MDRLTNIDPSAVESWRASTLEEADNSPLPDESDPLDSRLRVRDVGPEQLCSYQDANGDWQPTRLRQGDHVRTNDDLEGEVVCPGVGRTQFLLYHRGFRGWTCQTFDVSAVVDRAPVDTNEPGDPMPVIPVPEPAP